MNPTKLLHIDPDIVNTGLDSVVVIYSVLAVALIILIAVFWYTCKVYKKWKKLKDDGKMDWLDNEVHLYGNESRALIL